VPEPNDAIVPILQRIQGDLAEVRRDLVEIRRTLDRHTNELRGIRR
jgi:hypothetical protein